MEVKPERRPLAALSPPTAQSPIDFLYNAAPLGDLTFVVGQRLDQRVQTERAMLRTLAITGFVIVLTMLGSGYFFSRTSLRKLEQMETVLAQVSDGDMATRMAVSPKKDQIDRIALRLNTHLDTLSRLMLSTRATAAAIAHDLRSPLARAYLGLGRALDRVDAGADPRAEIEDTQAELERMTHIFDSFLRLARIEAGGMARGLPEWIWRPCWKIWSRPIRWWPKTMASALSISPKTGQAGSQAICRWCSRWSSTCSRTR